VQGISNALLVPFGLGLVLMARGLSRQRRRAWQLSVAFLGGSAAVDLLHRVDYGATATALLALALIARRDDFGRAGDRKRNRRLAVRAALLIAALYSYGAAALWVNRLLADQPFTGAFALRETSAALVGAKLHGSVHLSGSFGHWFPLSGFALALAAAGIVIASWLAPWRYRLAGDLRARERARALVEDFGVDTLAPFALRGDKSYFFSDDERAFLAYKVVAGVAVVSGDPVGPDDAVPELLRRFLAFARERDWRIAVLGAGERALHLYRAAGLRVLYHGEEAVVQTAGFSLEGRAVRKVRQSVTRLEREGYSAEVIFAGDVGATLRAELQDIFDEWRGSSAVKGFTMELDSLFRLEQDEALFVIGRDADGVPQGFIHFVVARRGHALSLSSMPRRRTTPNGLNEWLVVTMLEWAKVHGFDRVSLNFAPFAALLAGDADQLTAGKRVQRRALGALKGHGFQLENLLAFNRKFFPEWERRYVVYERMVDLPRVGLAGLAAEGYLPLRWART
jgi:lysyl-tRNA synthetase class 2